MSSVNNFTLRGGVFMRQGNVNTDALGEWPSAILHEGCGATSGWLIEDVIVTDNWNNGIQLQGPNDTVRRAYSTNNGRYGIGTACSGGSVTFDQVRVSFNNAKLLNPGGNSSASKFTGIAAGGTVTVRESWFHDNKGFGIWADMPGQPTAAHFVENVVEHNSRSGLFVEGLQGPSRIQHNYALNNGYDTSSIGGQTSTFANAVQIRITHADCSPMARCDVSFNDVDFTLAQSGNLGGALLLWNHNPPHPGQVSEWDVHNNRFFFRAAVTQRIGGQDTDLEGTQVWDGDNRFFDNEYHVVNTTTAFWKWDSGAGQGVAKTYPQWQAFHPGEDHALISI
jgi:hypothetical protein